MNPDNIDRLLVQWGDYREAMQRTALGYPSSTAESRAGEGKAESNGMARVPTYFPGDRLIWRLDREIAEMPAQGRRAIKLVFEEGLSLRAAGRSMKLGINQFRELLAGAKWWLARGLVSR